MGLVERSVFDEIFNLLAVRVHVVKKGSVVSHLLVHRQKVQRTEMRRDELLYGLANRLAAVANHRIVASLDLETDGELLWLPATEAQQEGVRVREYFLRLY